MKKKLPAPVVDSPKVAPEEHAVLTDLLKKNIAWSEAIYKQNVSIQKHLRWMTAMGYVRVLILLVPLVLGIIYLPPLLSAAWDQYQAVIGLGNGGVRFDAETIRKLLDQFAAQ